MRTGRFTTDGREKEEPKEPKGIPRARTEEERHSSFHCRAPPSTIGTKEVEEHRGRRDIMPVTELKVLDYSFLEISDVKGEWEVAQSFARNDN